MFVAQYYGKKDFDGLRTSAGLVLKYVVAVSGFFLLQHYLFLKLL